MQGGSAGGLDTLSVELDYNVLPATGSKLLRNVTFNLLYPDSTLPDSLLPRTTVVVTPHTLLAVRFLSCPLNQRWQYGIEDAALSFYSSDSLVTTSAKTVSLYFRTTGRCAGCIYFAAMDPSDPARGVQRASPGASIMYRCDPIDSIRLDLTRESWKVDTVQGFSTIYLYLSGNTNAFKIKVETYGDGVPWGHSIFPDVRGDFDDSMAIAFTPGPDDFAFLTGTRIGVYGTVSSPEIILLANPGHK